MFSSFLMISGIFVGLYKWNNRKSEKYHSIREKEEMDENNQMIIAGFMVAVIFALLFEWILSLALF